MSSRLWSEYPASRFCLIFSVSFEEEEKGDSASRVVCDQLLYMKAGELYTAVRTYLRAT